MILNVVFGTWMDLLSAWDRVNSSGKESPKTKSGYTEKQQNWSETRKYYSTSRTLLFEGGFWTWVYVPNSWDLLKWVDKGEWDHFKYCLKWCLWLLFWMMRSELRTQKSFLSTSVATNCKIVSLLFLTKKRGIFVLNKYEHDLQKFNPINNNSRLRLIFLRQRLSLRNCCIE